MTTSSGHARPWWVRCLPWLMVRDRSGVAAAADAQAENDITEAKADAERIAETGRRIDRFVSDLNRGFRRRE